jgi:intracellular septation protein A
MPSTPATPVMPVSAPGSAIESSSPERANPPAPPQDGAVFRVPSPLASFRHALPGLVESALVPAVLFYVFLTALGLKGALIAGLAWSYLALVRRLLTRQRIPGMLLVGCAVLTVRTVIALMTGSAFVYFLQPVAATCAVGLAFLVSSLMGRPLIDRFARDFCPLDPDMLVHPLTKKVFGELSLLWGAVMLANAGVVTWFLLTSSVGVFVIERTAASWLFTGAAIAASVLHFSRRMRRGGFTLRWDLGHAATN